MTVFVNRQARAAALLKAEDIGAAAFVPGAQFTYLTGVHLHLMERPTLFVMLLDGAVFGVMKSLSVLR